MAGSRLLLQVALLSVLTVCALAGKRPGKRPVKKPVKKEEIKYGVADHIQCAVCKQAVKEASRMAKDENIESDKEGLVDLVEDLCSGNQFEGKWTTKMDIVRKQSTKQLVLDPQDEPRKCKNECRAVQKACSMSMKNKEEGLLVSLIAQGAGIGRLQKEVCKKPCKKSLPELSEWQDEPFELEKPPEPPKDEDLRKSMGDYNAKRALIAASINDTIDILSSELDLKMENVRSCYVGSDAASYASQFALEVDVSLYHFLKKNITYVHSGLGKLGKGLAVFAKTIAHLCKKNAVPAKKLEAFGTYLAECHFDTSSVEYKPMQYLKVRGHAIHKELNYLMAAFMADESESMGVEVSKTLAKLLKQVEGDIESSTLKMEL